MYPSKWNDNQKRCRVNHTLRSAETPFPMWKVFQLYEWATLKIFVQILEISENNRAKMLYLMRYKIYKPRMS